ncbi:MAG: 50S ribosomal protein L22 [Methanocellales archaeon]|nr:50S ribosomal protein L22 [Methanocellales archaeon]MDD3291127.1 50S ribosomal protein L22 [Methanocellales archaeon]MDD5235012.1 50S ribosomal protein L22 [Methanocellales archaeon]MDD5484617.1 50S ribosomal protein L22 [Methanocellales archaeon]
MAKINYSLGIKSDTTAKAMCYEVKISPKHAREICRELKAMRISQAREYLEDVIALKRPVPFKRHNRNVGHRRGLHKWDAGRYPQKAAFEILRLVKNAQSNAEYKGLDPEHMQILHISAKRGRVIEGFFPRAMGRTTPKHGETVNIEIILEEVH